MKFENKKIAIKASETLNRFIETIKINHGRTTKKTKIIMGAGALFLVFAVIALTVNASQTVYTLTANGIEAGYIEKPSEITEITTATAEDFQEKTGSLLVVADEAKVTVVKADARKSDVELLSTAEIRKILSDPSLYTADSWVVKIDDNSLLSTVSETEASAILDGVKNSYKAKDSILLSASFKQNVTVTNEMAAMNLIMDSEAAVQLIVNGTVEPKTYVVKAGDTMWDIAAKTKMKTAELAAANPGFEPDKLKIGQTLNLFEKKPYVTVLTKEKITENKAIEYKTVYENTAALYKGEVKVKSPGVLGSEATEMEVVKENGAWVSTKVLATKVISEPVTQVALKGTKSLSTFTGTGNLNWPVAGAISSSFGSRGGGRHTGLDIRAPKGSPIRASDDGVVISTKYDGAYGNLIKLDHGKGVQTWYAHCLEFNAAIGDIVRKGDIIAYVGNTGRSTGYHVHFEVRINGVPVNPRNYL